MIHHVRKWDIIMSIQCHASEVLYAELDVPALDVAPGWMIGARTRLLDSWEPQCEWIRMPQLSFAHQRYRVWSSSIHAPSSRTSQQSRLEGKKHLANALQIDGLCHDVRSWGGENIAHAILGGALSSLACQHAIRNAGIDETITTLIPAKTKSYVRELYHILGISTLLTDQQVSGQLVQTNLSPAAFVSVAEGLLPTSLVDRLEANSNRHPKRIYVARRGSRSIRNADEIESLMIENGFTIIYPEQLPVMEQLRYFWHADTVAGIHGAALAMMLFRVLKPNCKPVSVLELFGPGYIVTCYRHLTSIIGGHWVGVRGRIEPAVVYDLDVNHDDRLWVKAARRLPGFLRKHILQTQLAWPRTHAAASFEIDPETVATAFNLIADNSAEPPERQM